MNDTILSLLNESEWLKLQADLIQRGKLTTDQVVLNLAHRASYLDTVASQAGAS